MAKMDKIVKSFLIDNIWIPPKGRPFWTIHNKRGNCGPELTDEELDEYGLSEFKNHEEAL